MTRYDFTDRPLGEREQQALQLLEWGYRRVRILEDGFIIGVMHMHTTNWRLHFGMDHFGPWANYCYNGREAAYAGLEGFDQASMQEPEGWFKHIETNRCRVDADPNQESIGWPIPQPR